MGHLHMRRQGLQPTKEKPPDTDPEENTKTNVVFSTTVDPSTKKKGKIIQIYADVSPPLQLGETDKSTSCICMIVIPP